MKTLLLAASSLVATAAFALGPRIDPATVSLTQDGARLVTVKYTLENCPGIVTLDFQTNRLNAATTDEADWVSIGGENVQGVEGDVNRLVTELGEHTLTWQPRELWPDHKTKTGAFRAVVTVWATNAPPDYLVVDLVKDKTVHYYTSADFLPGGGLTNDIYRTDSIVLRKIAAKGRVWNMGLATTQYGSSANNRQHKVILTNDYYMGVFQLTRGQFRKFASANRTAQQDYYYAIKDGGGNIWQYGSVEGYADDVATVKLDVVPVLADNGAMRGSAGDGYDFIANRHKVQSNKWLGHARTKTGVDFDLPTEAQWEFAARGGRTENTPNGEMANAGAASSVLTPIAHWGGSIMWYRVGTKLPNDYGLYDVLGNGYECVLDWYAEDYGGLNVVFAPEGPKTGSAFVIRALYTTWDQSKHHIGHRQPSNVSSPTSLYKSVRIMCPLTLTYPESEK